MHIPGGSVCSCVAPSLGVLGLALLSSPHMQRFECMFVCVFWVLSCCHTLHPTAGCNYHRDRVHKKQKTKNKKNKNPHKIIIHSPYPYSSLKKELNIENLSFTDISIFSLSGNSTCWCLLLCCWSAAVCLVCCCALCAVLCCVIFEFAGGLLLGMQGYAGAPQKITRNHPGKTM